MPNQDAGGRFTPSAKAFFFCTSCSAKAERAASGRPGGAPNRRASGQLLDCRQTPVSWRAENQEPRAPVRTASPAPRCPWQDGCPDLARRLAARHGRGGHPLATEWPMSQPAPRPASTAVAADRAVPLQVQAVPPQPRPIRESRTHLPGRGSPRIGRHMVAPNRVRTSIYAAGRSMSHGSGQRDVQAQGFIPLPAEHSPTDENRPAPHHTGPSPGMASSRVFRRKTAAQSNDDPPGAPVHPAHPGRTAVSPFRPAGARSPPRSAPRR